MMSKSRPKMSPADGGKSKEEGDRPPMGQKSGEKSNDTKKPRKASVEEEPDHDGEDTNANRPPPREDDEGPPKNLPACQPDGSFVPKQCMKKTCHCVDLMGKPIEGTKRHDKAAEQLTCGEKL